MRIGDTPRPEISALLEVEGLFFGAGPYIVRVRSSVPTVGEALHLIGGHHPIAHVSAFADFDINVQGRRQLRVQSRRNARLLIDGHPLFGSFPTEHSYAMFEWGLNWCVATRSDRYLLVHSAVVEKGGRALLLPAPPGSGKSTLCAALVCRGWRLLSDEVAMLTSEGRLLPIPRPVSLKNTSIDVIRNFDPTVVIGGTAHDTHKGTVAYMRPPADSVDRQSETATPAWIVFPKFEAGSTLRFEPYSKARTLVYLAHNSFNYHVHGARGFELLGRILDGCDCYNLSYGSLEDALRSVESLAASDPASPRIP